MSDPVITICRGDWRQAAYRVRKQPREVRSITIDLSDWVAGRDDNLASVSVDPAGPDLLAEATLVGTRVTLTLSGGVHGGRYNAAVLINTDSTPPNVREIDFLIEVKEVV